MVIFLFVLIYASALFFVGACLFRAVRYARMPLHLRWELYPVPHESPDRVKHGGSYFEAAEWWTEPGRFHLWGEIRYMVPEMLFLKGLWESNRRLWFRSYPFHAGLYLLTGAVLLVALRSILTVSAPDLAAGILGWSAAWLCKASGASGVALAIAGAAGLLHRRLTDRDLRPFTTAGDIFNLAFFLVTLVLLGAGYLLRAPDAPGMGQIALAIFRMDPSIRIGSVFAAGLISGALLLAYIPCTHMAHFIGKYFTYHAVRWDDMPLGRRAELRTRIARNLALRPTWAAGHVGADGKKSWGDIAAAEPGKGGAA